MKMSKRLITLLLILAGFMLIPAGQVNAAVELYDGRLMLNGYVKETVFIRTSLQDREDPYHDSPVDYIRTNALLEALYTVKDRGDLKIKLYGGVKAWWDKAPMVDDALRRSIPHRDRKDHILPQNFDRDILTEAYVHIVKGPFELRVGKQIVIWGQLDAARVADVINPLDLRTAMFGIDNWEDMKQGLWMIRALYQSQLPGNLLFEVIFNPGDFKKILLPGDGTHYGEDVSSSLGGFEDVAFGMGHWNLEKLKRDAPGFNLSNYEFGIKVRGYAYNVDWTLLYYNSLDDGGVAHPDKIGDAIFSGYLLPAITGGTIPDWPSEKLFYFKRYHALGGVFQTYIDPLWQTVWKMEWGLQIGVPMNKGTDGKMSGVYDWTKRNVIGFAVNVSKYVTIPKFTDSSLATGRQMSVSLTYYYDKVLNHDHDLVLGSSGHAVNHSVNDSVSLFIMQDLFHATFIFTCNMSYHFHTGKWMAAPSIGYYFPGKHWRCDVGYMAFGGSKAKEVSRNMAKKDSVMLRVRYEF